MSTAVVNGEDKFARRLLSWSRPEIQIGTIALIAGTT